MTGGQMAPTTIVGQRTATTRKGRNIARDGFPLNISKMIATLDGARLVERTSIHAPKEVVRTRKAIKRAFETQIRGEGFSMVEVLAMCPTYWGLSPVEATKRIENEIIKSYPLGILKG
jgi:2-oxoglutarate ferredoxin oxidoreductase subunit beta